MAKSKINLLERAISTIAPKWGYERQRFHAANQLLEQKRSYDAASRSRRTANWQATGRSANKEIELSLALLRNRSRELTRNNPYAKRAIQAITSNTIGTGIRPIPIVSTKGPEKRIKKAWADWGETTACDFDGHTNMYGLQRMAVRCIAESGEVIIRRRKTTDDMPVRLQVLEPDFLDSNKNTYNGIVKGHPYIIQGVQFNAKGQISGYWLYDEHPGEGYNYESNLVPAEDVIHVFYKERPGQVRGVPWGVSAALSLYDFDEYETAQLIRQKIAACFTIFVTDANGDDTGGTEDMLEKVEPGIIEYVPGNKTITMADPPGVQNYEEYTRSMLRKIAIGYGVPYEVLTGDLSNVNFSSGRMGWIEFQRLIGEWQWLMLMPMMMEPIWKWFVEAGVIAGKVPAGAKTNWMPPRREMIDPAKEIKGMSEAVRNGFMSPSAVIASMGDDPQEVFDQWKKDQELMDKEGFMFTCNPKYDKGRVDPDPEDPEEESAADKKKKNK